VAFDIELVEKANVINIWPQIQHLAENLQKRSKGRFWTADILNQAIELPYFVWIVKEEDNIIGFFICGIIRYPRKTYLDLNTLSGSRLKEWSGQALEVIEELGKKIGVDGMETSTAPALEKTWLEAGFKKEFITMTKSFKQENLKDQQIQQSDLLEVNEDDLLKEVANGR
jgi:hypothetical protein|tara:strand:+ start:598 stop:1107 length:510 start_codon:yes stop_codon:yes gene_type:complete